MVEVMNSSTVSAECAHRMHAACCYEDCACRCHLCDFIKGETA